MAIALPLAGCTTTQHQAQRVQLDSARQRAALEHTRVTVANLTVTAASVAEVSADGKTAIVVTVHNGGRKAVTDLPISVGYERPGGASVYLNSSANLNYFEAHLPAIPAGRSLTWIYTADRLLPRGAHPFARVGTKPAAPARLTEMDVRIGLSYGHSAGQKAVTIHLDNPSTVPQYQLQVYAYALRDGRYIAAGNVTVPDLGAGSKQRVKLALTGTAADGLHVEAVPTILQ
ncbi:MAG TPA: hypothetical protein VHV75_01890 [Solirubrobacteraceae bacterium]|jgi:hypothetical protein|nr:hypothetical protein [Solirubrobacteraceae bacterium]